MMLATLVLGLALSPGPPEPPSPADGPTTDASASRVLVLPLEVEGSLSDSWRTELRRALSEGLSDGRFELIPAPASAASCRVPACLGPIADQTDAQGFVRPRIVVAERDYEVVVELLDARGERVATSEESCSVCGMAEVITVVRGQAAALRGRLAVRALAPPTLELRSRPPGAEVRIDGALVGTTPLQRELTEGAHHIEITRPGYLPEVRPHEATPGVHESLDVALSIDDAPRRRRRLAGIVTAGLGLGGVAAGAVLWGLDSRPAPGDRCAGDNIDGAGRCRYLYDTRAMGIGLTAAGVAVLATGVGLWLSGRRRGGSTRSARAATGSRLVLR